MLRTALRWVFLGSIYSVLFWAVLHGQAVEEADFGAAIYWDANSEPDLEDYGVYRALAPCTDPAPTPTTCPGFAEVAAVPQGSDPIQWTEPGPITFVTETYHYRVTARNTSRKESGFSTELAIHWLNPAAPGAPGSPRLAPLQVFFIWDSEVIINVENNPPAVIK